MDSDMLRELVASPHWRWMPGMAVYYCDPETGKPYTSPDERGRLVDINGCGEGRILWPEGLSGFCRFQELPDVTDPATLGCLLALVREAWRAPVCVWWTGKSWDAEVVEHPDLDCEPYGKGSSFSGATEAEALVVALLAAPEGRNV